jgi:HTH-type transcriptional regulator/antitoxin HigA
MATDVRTWPDVAIPPGELLAETLESLGMSQAELARRTGRPVQAINEIVRGAKEITPETALQLERVLGTPAHVWVRLEADYRYNVARLQALKSLEDEVPLAEAYPYREMVQHGWVADVRNPVERVGELCRFFRVGSLRQLETRELAVAWRRSTKVEIARAALLVWLRQGEREAEKVSVRGSFDRDMLRSKLPLFRSLTTQRAEMFEGAIRQHLADCGVALVFVPHLPKTGVHGATQWHPNRVVMQLSVRCKWTDIFWFSFFHELGHLLLHPRKGVFVNPESGDKSSDEKEADRFAADTLIPPRDFKQKCARLGVASAAAVVACAKELGIAAGILVGRLQYENLLPRSHLNHLKEKLQIVDR